MDTRFSSARRRSGKRKREPYQCGGVGSGSGSLCTASSRLCFFIFYFVRLTLILSLYLPNVFFHIFCLPLSWKSYLNISREKRHYYVFRLLLLRYYFFALVAFKL